MIVFILLHNIPNLLGKISPRLLPPGWHDLKDPYDVVAMVRQQETHGRSRSFALLPPWMRKLLSGNKRFWEFTPEEIQRRLEGRQLTEDSGNAAAELRQKERNGLRIMMGIHFTNPDQPEITGPLHAPFDVEHGSQSNASERLAGSATSKEI